MRARNAIDQSIRIKTAFERPFSLDLIVRTPWQIERGLKDDDWFLREITQKGKVLYEARDSKVGSQSRTGFHLLSDRASTLPPGSNVNTSDPPAASFVSTA